MIKKQEKWDRRFLGLAELVSCWSKDPSCKCGAVIVRPDKTICSVGFNGFPQKMEDYDNWLLEREEKYSRIIHAEMNALLFAKESVEGYTFYTYPLLTCDRCAVHMIQAGISRVVSYILKENDLGYNRWSVSLNKSVDYYLDCKIDVTEYTRE